MGRFDSLSSDVVQLVGKYSPPVDARLARLAARQHGIVSRNQLLVLGLDADRIAYRIEVGRLHRLYRGVYAVGHVHLTQRGRWLAAVVACRVPGGESVLSHRAAGWLHGILRSAPSNPIVNVETRPGFRRAIVATTALESTPPLKSAPIGTSATMRRDTASVRRRRNSDPASSSDGAARPELRSRRDGVQ